MNRSVQKSNTSTQKFIEIADIVDDVVIVSGSNACLIIEVQATNFALLSAEEQDAKIYSYAALLNSLSFPIQIVIKSKRLNISSYLKLLEEEKQNSKNPKLSEQIGLYKGFVEELVKVNAILDKKFYIVIPYSSLEKGLTGVKEQTGMNSSQSFFLVGAKASLHSKAESLHAQLGRLNLKTETLEKERLVKTFYEIFNDINIDSQQTEHTTKPMTLGKEQAK
nr:hypothetical protein [Candidatus Levybacteria bacterium]